jgi:hypothetical protein
MFKRIVVSVVVLLSLGFSPSAHAQILYANSSLKNALVEYLFQYGKEIFYQGVDPQEASFVLQRALVLDCHHQGAQAFLNKLHRKYPEVSVRVWGCADEETVPAVTQEISSTPPPAAQEPQKPVSTEKAADTKDQALRRDYQKAANQMDALERDIKDKDDRIARLNAQKKAAVKDNTDDIAYANIARDQNDLIRIQQGNIDYLKSELAETKKQLQGGGAPDSAFTKTQIELADSGLDAQEHKMAADAKDEEARDLRQRLNDLQEQLALVQKIVDEKNRTIESLEKELKPAANPGQ